MASGFTKREAMSASRLDCTWPVWLIALGALLLLVALWSGVLWRIAAEAQEEEQEIDRHTMNLARVFEEHTVRTLGTVGQALLLVKCGYERDVDVFDLVAAVEQEMTIGHLYPPGRGDRHERRLPVFHPGGFRVCGSA